MTTHLKILDPGFITTIQDYGRYGHQAIGVSVSGALDRYNLELANHLVGNSLGEAAFEIRLKSPTFEVQADCVTIALTGTEASIELIEPLNEQIAAYRSVTLNRGQQFRIGSIADSAVCYLAVKGGFNLPHIYGSLSTCLSAGFGGFKGRRLLAGDEIPLNENAARQQDLMALPSPFIEPLFQYRKNPIIRAISGPQADYFTSAAHEIFFSTPYTLSKESNRMGARLEGAPLAHVDSFNIASDGIVKGAIQVPGNGLPIILLADCQTTGGYPKIATVISTDLPLLGRMMAGTEFRFENVTVAEAEQILKQNADLHHKRLDAITKLENIANSLEERLRNTNLISGIIDG